ncbi:hypothetical protein HMI55_002616, partial [Coelomomyces lativittatus]
MDALTAIGGWWAEIVDQLLVLSSHFNLHLDLNQILKEQDQSRALFFNALLEFDKETNLEDTLNAYHIQAKHIVNEFTRNLPHPDKSILLELQSRYHQLRNDWIQLERQALKNEKQVAHLQALLKEKDFVNHELQKKMDRMQSPAWSRVFNATLPNHHHHHHHHQQQQQQHIQQQHIQHPPPVVQSSSSASLPTSTPLVPSSKTTTPSTWPTHTTTPSLAKLATPPTPSLPPSTSTPLTHPVLPSSTSSKMVLESSTLLPSSTSLLHPPPSLTSSSSSSSSSSILPSVSSPTTTTTDHHHLRPVTDHDTHPPLVLDLDSSHSTPMQVDETKKPSWVGHEHLPPPPKNNGHGGVVVESSSSSSSLSSSSQYDMEDVVEVEDVVEEERNNNESGPRDGPFPLVLSSSSTRLPSHPPLHPEPVSSSSSSSSSSPTTLSTSSSSLPSFLDPRIPKLTEEVIQLKRERDQLYLQTQVIPDPVLERHPFVLHLKALLDHHLQSAKYWQNQSEQYQYTCHQFKDDVLGLEAKFKDTVKEKSQFYESELKKLQEEMLRLRKQRDEHMQTKETLVAEKQARLSQEEALQHLVFIKEARIHVLENQLKRSLAFPSAASSSSVSEEGGGGGGGGGKSFKGVPPPPLPSTASKP